MKSWTTTAGLVAVEAHGAKIEAGSKPEKWRVTLRGATEEFHIDCFKAPELVIEYLRMVLASGQHRSSPKTLATDYLRRTK